MKVIRERICNAVHKCLQWEDGEIAGIDMLKLEQQIDGILAQLQQHIVMQSEGSDGAEGAAVGQRSGGKSVCVECEAPAGRAISVGFRRNCIQRFGYLCPCRNRSTKFN